MYDITGTEEMLPIGRTNHQTPVLPRRWPPDEGLAAGQFDAYPPAESAAQVAVRLAYGRLLRTELLVAYGQLAQDRAQQRVAVGGCVLDASEVAVGTGQLVGAEADVQADADDDAGLTRWARIPASLRSPIARRSAT